jgi:uncharacterized membrane protein YheB (UPF0754 family)
MIQYVFDTIVQTMTGPDWWLYALIPVISGLIGWITNIIALKMTFHPVNFWGYPPYLGWQGVVPRKALKIAEKSVAIITENLITIRDVFEKIDPNQVAEEMEPAFDSLIEPSIRDVVSKNTPTVWESLPGWIKEEIFDRIRHELPILLDNILEAAEREFDSDQNPEDLAHEMRMALDDSLEPLVEEVMKEHCPTLWESVPGEFKNKVFRDVRSDLPEMLSKMIEDWKEEIDEIFDLRQMILDELLERRDLLNRIFQESGGREFKFIERSGLYFGTLFGIIQMFVWMFWSNSWVLPIAGLFVGTATNWLAIKLIFQPKYPKNIGPFTFHGFAFKRKEEIINTWSQIVVDEVLYPEKIFNNLFQGPGQDDLFLILQKHTHVQMDKVGGLMNPLVRRVIGAEQYFDMKNKISREMMDILPEAMSYSYDYLDDALDIRNTLRENLHALPPEEYEDILRTPFQEDEWILVAVGGALGFGAGVFQLIFLFGGSIGIPFL